MSAHAIYAPSAMQRIALCPASVRATEGMVDVPSPYAMDGTDAHTTLIECLSVGERDAATGYGGKPQTHRADTKQERIESVQYALDEVYSILDAYSDAQLYLETRVLFPSAYSDETWGTADIIIVIPCISTMYVIDFKHGAGEYVEVKDNWQIGDYAVAALSTLRDAYKAEIVVTGIIQPRAFAAEGPFRTDVQSRAYYETAVKHKIEYAIWASQQPDAPFVPGREQCKFCPRRANCPAREAAALAVVGANFASVKDVTTARLPDPRQMPVDRLAYIRAASEILRGWLKDCDNVTFEIAKSGVYVPGFKIVEVGARRAWYQTEAMTAATIMSLAGVSEDEVYPRALINITDAEKLIVKAYKDQAPRGKKKEAAELAKNAFAHLTTKASSGNLTLVPENDPRPAVNIAHTAFANVKFIRED